MLIRQSDLKGGSDKPMNASETRYYMLHGKRKVDEYKQYDLKSRQIVDYKKKKRDPYASQQNSDSDDQ